MACLVSKRPVLQVSMWAMFAAVTHALSVFFLIVDANGSFNEAFQQGSWQWSIFTILVVTIVVFVAVMSLGILWFRQLIPRSIFIGALIGCATIGALLGSWASYLAVENNPQDIYWDTATGSFHLLEIFSVFYPWFLFTFLSAAFIVFLLLASNYRLEAKVKQQGSKD